MRLSRPLLVTCPILLHPGHLFACVPLAALLQLVVHLFVPCPAILTVVHLFHGPQLTRPLVVHLFRALPSLPTRPTAPQTGSWWARCLVPSSSPYTALISASPAILIMRFSMMRMRISGFDTTCTEARSTDYLPRRYGLYVARWPQRHWEAHHRPHQEGDATTGNRSAIGSAARKRKHCLFTPWYFLSNSIRHSLRCCRNVGPNFKVVLEC